MTHRASRPGYWLSTFLLCACTVDKDADAVTSTTSATSTAGTGTTSVGGACPPNMVYAEPPGCPSGLFPEIPAPGCYEVCEEEGVPCESGVCSRLEVNPCPCLDEPAMCCDACAGMLLACLEPAGVCDDAGDGNAFALDPFGGESLVGNGTCTVTQQFPIVLACAGDIDGTFELDVNNGAGPFLAVDDVVVMHYAVEVGDEYLGEYIKIEDEATGQVLIVATHASALTPPEMTAAEWYQNIEVMPHELGCELMDCDDGSGSSWRPMGLTFSATGGNSLALTPGGGGIIDVGGVGTYYPDIRVAREGACGAMLGDQQSWWSFSVVLEPTG